MDLSGVKTCELVKEIESREGVEKVWAEPYQTKELSVEGPATILIIID